MIDYQPFIQHIRKTRLKRWADPLMTQLNQTWATLNDGNLPRLLQVVNNLPELIPETTVIDDIIQIIGNAAESTEPLEAQLRQLMPWRKGPFKLFDININSEWRCDIKWNRLVPHISNLNGRHVLDVGSGNGYYGWRMKAAGAMTVAGIDPSWLSVVQHLAINHFMQDETHAVLPFTLEEITPNLEIFDTVFSMGVLYHRRSPLDHLFELRGALRPGGELILETIVIDGGKNEALVPIGRYARMNNVWFLPTARTLAIWLEKMGFEKIRIVDESRTTAAEQRVTDWKPGQSLENYLDPNNPNKTIEGHPAPIRALLIAEKPLNQRLKRYRID
ncbi:MAG: tRNA 5-methoxyuridine(34)/uridine 5-oxyacetic acid(34) synthase CmoB [Reinekea sp.]|jgi:tRNA (mo5U34)-methyltransferase